MGNHERREDVVSVFFFQVIIIVVVNITLDSVSIHASMGSAHHRHPNSILFSTSEALIFKVADAV